MGILLQVMPTVTQKPARDLTTLAPPLSLPSAQDGRQKAQQGGRKGERISPRVQSGLTDPRGHRSAQVALRLGVRVQGRPGCCVTLGRGTGFFLPWVPGIQTSPCVRGRGGDRGSQVHKSTARHARLHGKIIRETTAWLDELFNSSCPMNESSKRSLPT